MAHYVNTPSTFLPVFLFCFVLFFGFLEKYGNERGCVLSAFTQHVSSEIEETLTKNNF